MRHRCVLRCQTCNIYRAHKQFKSWNRIPCVLRPSSKDVIASFRAEKRQHSMAFSSHLADDSSVFRAQNAASVFSTPFPTEKQIITEHDHWTNSHNLDTDAGEKDAGQSPGGLDSSAVRIQSNLDDLTIWDDAVTQHDPLSHTCKEAEHLVGATLVSHAVYL